MIKENSSSSTNSLSKKQDHPSEQGNTADSRSTISAFYSPFYNFGAQTESTTAQRLLKTLNKMSDLIADIKTLNSFIRLLYREC